MQIPGRGVGKFNESYSDGGAPLVVKTIKQETGLKVNHVIIVNFKGFSQAVDKIDCVYVDVDRKYFNNNIGRYAGDQFAAIDIKAGYQKLCGQKALDYVRFRHFDSDIQRAARQQSFLRQAKQQVGVSKLITSANSLKKIVSRTPAPTAASQTAQTSSAYSSSAPHQRASRFTKSRFRTSRRRLRAACRTWSLRIQVSRVLPASS